MVTEDNVENPFLNIDSEEICWLREYKIHQETILYTRVNIFVLVMSILIATTLMAQDKNKLISIIICGFSIVVTVLWFLIIRRQKQVVDDIRDMLLKSDKVVYEKIRQLRNLRDKGKDKGKKRRISGQSLLFFGLPLVFTLFWLILFVLLILCSFN